MAKQEFKIEFDIGTIKHLSVCKCTPRCPLLSASYRERLG